MEFGLSDDGDYSEYSGDAFVEISSIFATQDAYIFGKRI